MLTRAQLMALLRNRELANVLFSDSADGDEFLNHWGVVRREPKDPNRFPEVPSEEGRKLMRAGAFGANDYDIHAAQKHIARRMLERELGVGDREHRRRNGDLVTQVSGEARGRLSNSDLLMYVQVHDPWESSRTNYSLR